MATTVTDRLGSSPTVSPLDPNLTAFASLAIAANTLPYGTGPHQLGLTSLTAYARTLLAGADDAALRVLLGLVIGSSVQAYNSNLAVIAGLSPGDDAFIQRKSGIWASRTPAQVAADLPAVVGDSGSGGTKGSVPAPSAGDAAAKKVLGASGAFVLAPAVPDVILEDQKTSGTGGGTFTSGADRTRDLNTKVRDSNSYCTLSTNQFTLAAGTWYIEWSAPGYQTGKHQTLLRDVTGSADLKRGSSETSTNATAVQTRSAGQHVVTINSSNTFEIRRRTEVTSNTSGFGTANSFGTEIYSVVKCWKIG